LVSIEKLKAAHPEKNIKIARQAGRGKGDAVRLGFSMATGDLLMILDADLTMPPEDLPKFYQAVAAGRCPLGDLAAQQAAVGLSIGRRARALGLAGDEPKDSADDGFKCLGEHGSASVILELPNALLELVDLVGRFL
jgi:glycosyltransferase involved in cell wall biosynthesis